MKNLRLPISQAAGLVLFLLLYTHAVCKAPNANAGFYIPEDIREVSLRYRTQNDLIILPVIINDSILVNLVLDTGCRNLVLFGKKFQKLFNLEPNQKVQFSGLGAGKPVYGKLALKNKVTISEVIGERIPVVVVPERNVFERSNIDGVIGYDIFIKFEVELDPARKIIVFRPAGTAVLPSSFNHVPITVVDSRPILASRISLSKDDSFACSLMIDTGSALGLLLKTTDISRFSGQHRAKQLGWGFNGLISGFEIQAKMLELEGYSIASLPTGIIESPWHNYASIGMNVLKGYSLILNYCKGYAGFKKNT